MEKLTYTRPTLIDHGNMIDRTKGSCTCLAESQHTFAPKPVEG